MQRGSQCFYGHIVFGILQPHPYLKTSFTPSLVLLVPVAWRGAGRGGGEEHGLQAVNPLTCVFGVAPLHFVPHLHRVSDV